MSQVDSLLFKKFWISPVDISPGLKKTPSSIILLAFQSDPLTAVAGGENKNIAIRPDSIPTPTNILSVNRDIL